MLKKTRQFLQIEHADLNVRMGRYKSKSFTHEVKLDDLDRLYQQLAQNEDSLRRINGLIMIKIDSLQKLVHAKSKAVKFSQGHLLHDKENLKAAIEKGGNVEEIEAAKEAIASDNVSFADAVMDLNETENTLNLSQMDVDKTLVSRSPLLTNRDPKVSHSKTNNTTIATKNNFLLLMRKWNAVLQQDKVAKKKIISTVASEKVEDARLAKLELAAMHDDKIETENAFSDAKNKFFRSIEKDSSSSDKFNSILNERNELRRDFFTPSSIQPPFYTEKKSPGHSVYDNENARMNARVNARRIFFSILRNKIK
jgi:hypothetical protein